MDYEYKYRDSTGEIHTVTVKGTVMLSSPVEHIYLARLSRTTYRVHYGLQHTFHGSLEAAMAEFGNCFLHFHENS